MSAKLFILSCLVSAVFGGFVNYGHHQPAAAVHHQVIYQKAAEHNAWDAKSHWAAKEHEAPANYEFNYEVHDEHTGDIKRQSEVAKNGAISGQYSLVDADGFHRVVKYTADDHHGFQATVDRQPLGHHHAQPTIIKKIIVAPSHAAWPNHGQAW